MGKVKELKSGNYVIWCDKWDYWRTIQACAGLCSHYDKCESIMALDDDIRKMETNKYSERKRNVDAKSKTRSSGQ